MALKLSKNTPNGGAAEYWRVMPGMSIDVVAQQIIAPVMLYVNASSRQASKRPIHPSELEAGDAPNSVTLTGADAIAALQTGDPRAALYAVLKTKDFFTGAEDV